MRFFDYIKVALRNLTRQKSRTALTIIAITIGSLSLILMASLIISIRMSLIDQFKNLGAFNLVTVIRDPNSVDQNNLMGTNGDPSDGKKIDDVTLATVKKITHVVDASPILNVSINTMRLEGQDKKTWASMLAMDPDTDVFNVPIMAGRKIENNDMDKIVVGTRFLDDFKQRGHEQELIGKKVILNSKMGGSNSSLDWGDLPKKPVTNKDGSWAKPEDDNKGIDIEATIVGVADNGTVGDGANYINIAWARKLNTQVRWENDNEAQKECSENQSKINASAQQQAKESGQPYYGNKNDNVCNNFLKIVKDDMFNNQGYQSIVLKVDDEDSLKKVSDEISKLGYGAMTAQAMLDQINQIMTMIGIVLAVIGGISLFVAAIGIINTMVMATYERIREIGVMRACGATRATIRRMFTFEAALLGFWGGIFGLLISLLLGVVARLLVSKFGANLGDIPIDRIGSFPWWLIVGTVFFTTLVGMLSGLGPAIKAARLNPVDALRYD